MSYPHYLSLGTWFGGTTIADNPAGDDYKAGGGATLDYGLQYRLTNSLLLQNTIGFRYQGSQTGSGSNSGEFIESSIINTSRNWYIGGGFQYEFNNKVKDDFGNSIKFDPVVTPFLTFGYNGAPSASIGLKFKNSEYTISGTNVKVKGVEYGLFVVLQDNFLFY